MKESWPRAAETLARGGSNADAARSAGVTVRTVQRWRADEVAFDDHVEDFRSQLMGEAAGRLAASTTVAAEKLAEIVETGSDTHALAAARVILDQASRYRMDAVLESRIVALEIQAGLRKGTR